MNNDNNGSFKLRVDKIFGSLATPPQSSALRSPWTLSDDEIEKREWNRKKDDDDDEEEQIPTSSSFDGFFTNNNKNNVSRRRRQDFQDEIDDDDDKAPSYSSPSRAFNGSGDVDELEIRSSIGLDSTLDNEEEEDEFDKLAVGRENDSDRVYLKDVTDYGKFLNSHNVIPESFKDHVKDPRADLLAAKNRVKEDIEGPARLSSSRASDDTVPVPAATDPNLKSILKRKESRNMKLQKRVRFDPQCKEDDCNREFEEEQVTVIDTSLLPKNGPGVPDYTKGVEPQIEGISEDLPKSVKFTPKKKPYSVITVENNSKDKQNPFNNSEDKQNQKAGFPISIAAVKAEEDEVCAMEEDEPEMSEANKNASRSRRPGRQYRSKLNSDDTGS
ncbi:hypothetical protein GIB67_018878 [Kingdonia uniflora]|uniref:Protein TSSC4 n=1 Tax=Kingdonia uniflora TaxID=39325 RepID=A0A7J7MZJ5_9MAGN|nr:hypothetical protein GIB67_018878 [Kingdonia uniflora]